jgi:hypothetical protein
LIINEGVPPVKFHSRENYYLSSKKFDSFITIIVFYDPHPTRADFRLTEKFVNLEIYHGTSNHKSYHFPYSRSEIAALRDGQHVNCPENQSLWLIPDNRIQDLVPPKKFSFQTLKYFYYYIYIVTNTGVRKSYNLRLEY